MQPGRRRKPSIWTPVVWVLNAAGVIALLVVMTAYFARQPAEAAPAPFVYLGRTPRPTSTPIPTSYYLATITPNPLSTPVEDYSTPTPFVFTGGPAPNVIGYSVLGQPIIAYTFGQGENRYLVVAGIHGGYEGNTVDLANQMVVYLTQNPDFIPSDATLYVIPDMNPDAVARGRNADARVNANGVDLNRNFPSKNWAANWDHSLCWNDRPTTGGAYAGSEPETRAIMDFVKSHRILAMISYHAAALGVFPGGTPWQPASKDLARVLSAKTGYPYPPINIGCNYTGTLADWAVENGVGAAVDMELSTHQDAEFTRNLGALKALLGFSG
jgi:protein MpaA